MFASVISKQLPIEQVRQPRQRMPHVALACRECPRHLRPAQPFVDMRIEADVNGVVVKKKLEVLHRPVDRRDQPDQGDADKPRTFLSAEHRAYFAPLVLAYQCRSQQCRRTFSGPDLISKIRFWTTFLQEMLDFFTPGVL